MPVDNVTYTTRPSHDSNGGYITVYAPDGSYVSRHRNMEECTENALEHAETLAESDDFTEGTYTYRFVPPEKHMYLRILSSASGGGALPPQASGTAEGVTGTIAEGETITVAWDGTNGFGSGDSTPVFFMDSRGGSDGAALSTNDPLVGSYTDTSTAKYSTEAAHSKGASLELIDGSEGRESITKTTFSATQEFFISYWFFTPSGTGLPYHSGVETAPTDPNYPSSESNWKMTWLLYQEGSSGTEGEPDVCLPSQHAAGVNMAIGGNATDMHDDAPLNPPNMDQIHTFGEWVWMAIFEDGVGKRTVFSTINATKGYSRSSKSFIDYWASQTPQSFSQLNMIGWVRDTDQSRILYDDIYMATGPGAAGVVLIGDASTLATCTDLAVLRTSNRSNTSADAVVELGPFSDLSGKYLFVLDTAMEPVLYNGNEGRLIS